MAFRYINPGYSELIENSFTTKETFYNEIYNPQNHVAFTQTQDDSNTICCRFNDVPNNGFYVKFDFFHSNLKSWTNFYFEIRSTQNANYSWGVNFFSSTFKLCQGFDSFLEVYYNKIPDFYSNPYKTVWFHFDFINDFAEIIINDSYFSSTFSKSAFSYLPNTVFIKGPSDYFFSNIIISDEYISPKEQVIILPTNGTETDMTDNQDGSYLADQDGQTLFQTVDASSLITQFGSSSKITSLASAAIPAYRTAEGLTYLIGIDNINSQLTEHNKRA